MKKLSPEVSKFYKLITIRPGTYSFPEFGSIDLTQITLTEARELVADGFAFLVSLDPPKEKAPKLVIEPKLVTKPVDNLVTEPVEVPNKLKINLDVQNNYPEFLNDLNDYINNAETAGEDLQENIMDAESAGEDLQQIFSNAENAGEKLREIVLQAEDISQVEPAIFRGNKKFINKLLMLNYSELEFKEKTVFFNDEKYFNSKKYLLQDISQLHNKMKSYHAQLKLAKTDEERKLINKKLWIADDLKSQAFKGIDRWEHKPIPEEDPIERAARLAVAKEKQIKALTNYIGRFESKYSSMPDATEQDRVKKHNKIQEIEKRKQRLITLGSPYNRKKRS